MKYYRPAAFDQPAGLALFAIGKKRFPVFRQYGNGCNSDFLICFGIYFHLHWELRLSLFSFVNKYYYQRDLEWEGGKALQSFPPFLRCFF
jgi:hypothetical protein